MHDTTFAELLEDFDGRTHDVFRAQARSFSGALRRWFALLDQHPEISETVKQLEASLDLKEWKSTGLVEQTGMGIGRIDLPIDDDQRLGALLGLFRELAADEDSPWRFAHDFVSTARNVNINVTDLANQLFEPLSRDLRRQLVRANSLASAADAEHVVTLQGEALEAAIRALEEVRRSLSQTNLPLDPDERSQRLAELAAGQELLKAKRLSVAAMKATAGRALRQLASRFWEEGLGRAASNAWDLISKLWT